MNELPDSYLIPEEDLPEMHEEEVAYTVSRGPSIRELTSMCRNGEIDEALRFALEEYELKPDNLWTQRALSWPLYYAIRRDAEQRRDSLFQHLDRLASLQHITVADDYRIFENILWFLADYVKGMTVPSPMNREPWQHGVLYRLFSFLRRYSFPPSKGYTYLLTAFKDFRSWPGMKDFIDWWNLDNLLQEDYEEFHTEEGRSVMSVAEQVYCAYARALLQRRERDGLEEFIPRLDALAREHPEMTFPSYFSVRLKMKAGSQKLQTMKEALAFVARRRSDYWAWQLLADLFDEGSEEQVACWLRALSCKGREEMKDSLRRKVAWNLGKVKPEEFDFRALADSVDWERITDFMLMNLADEALAVVTYINREKHWAGIVYGVEKKGIIPFQKIPAAILSSLSEGSLLRISYNEAAPGKIQVHKVSSASENGVDLPYVKEVEGRLAHMPGKGFGFVRTGDASYFVMPSLMQRKSIDDGAEVKATVALTYSPARRAWSWTTLRLASAK